MKETQAWAWLELPEATKRRAQGGGVGRRGGGFLVINPCPSWELSNHMPLPTRKYNAVVTCLIQAELDGIAQLLFCLQLR